MLDAYVKITVENVHHFINNKKQAKEREVLNEQFSPSGRSPIFGKGQRLTSAFVYFIIDKHLPLFLSHTHTLSLSLSYTHTHTPTHTPKADFFSSILSASSPIQSHYLDPRHALNDPTFNNGCMHFSNGPFPASFCRFN